MAAILKEVVVEFVEEMSEKGEKQVDNLTKEDRSGMKSLIERRKKGEVMIPMTDKSGNLAADHRDNYK